MYEELKPLQDELLKIIIDFDAICKKANASFCLIYGSLLGAIRQGGFIPWDDDVDIGMLREDYDILVNFFKTQKVSNYKLYCAETDDACGLIYAKLIRLSGNEGFEKFFSHKDGLSIDIMPIDKSYSHYNIGQLVNSLRIYLLRNVIRAKEKLQTLKGIDSKKKMLIRKIVNLPYKRKTIEALTKKTIQLCKKYQNKNTPNLINYTDKIFNENENSQIWTERKIVKFESIECYVPQNAEIVLEHLYGKEWGTPPPEALRAAHDNKAVM